MEIKHVIGKPLPEYTGLTVHAVKYGIDSGGYGFLLIEFNGGYKLLAFEHSQSGEIAISPHNGPNIYPQSEDY